LAWLEAVILRLAVAADIFFHVPARQNPVTAAGGQALLYVDRNTVIGIRTRSVVQPHRRLAARQRHFAKRHAAQHQLARTGQGATGNGKRFVENGLVHVTSPYAGTLPKEGGPDQVLRDPRDCGLSLPPLSKRAGTPG